MIWYFITKRLAGLNVSFNWQDINRYPSSFLFTKSCSLGGIWWMAWLQLMSERLLIQCMAMKRMIRCAWGVSFLQLWELEVDAEAFWLDSCSMAVIDAYEWGSSPGGIANNYTSTKNWVILATLTALSLMILCNFIFWRNIVDYLTWYEEFECKTDVCQFQSY